ncbi:MAG TPA: acyltransferase domain-containing protein, partial [Acidimicrobiales bacterium]
DRIYAAIRGTGVSSDGRAATLMSPASKGQVLAIERAWRAAGLDPASVCLIEAHGSATRAGDSVEIATLRRVFEPAGGGATAPAWLGSVKSNIGHAMPASGIAGLIKSALALHHGVVPPTLHCHDPHPDLAPSRFEVVTGPRPWDDGATGGARRRVGINAFGFGGINAHVILEGVPGEGAGSLPFAPPHAGGDAARAAGDADDPPTLWWGRPRRRSGTGAAPRSPGDTRLFVCAGDDPAEVAARLDDTDAVLARTTLASLAGSHAGSGDAGPVRLAIADPTPKRLALARKVVARGQPWRGRNDVWFAPEGLVGAGGKVAFAFPGIEPTFEARVDDVAEHFGVVAETIARASDLEQQGANIIYVGRLLTEALAALAVVPDVVVGHSLGEWTAMLVAGTVTREAIDRFVHGIADGDLVLPDLVFLAAGCGIAVAEEAIAGLPDIEVSHDNCPHQVIVCGAEASVAVAERRLRARRVLAQALPFRTGFHTSMFGRYLQPFEQALGTLPLHRPRIPIYSSVSARPFPDDEDGMRDLGRRLYVERVRFRELVENLYADGVRVFVQPGVGSVVGFVGDTLHDRGHLSVAAAAPKRSGMAQVARVAAALWVEGADVPLDRLAPPDDASPGAAAPSTAACRAPAPAADTGARPPVLRFDASLVRGGLHSLPRPAADPAPDELTALDPGAGGSVGGPVVDEFRATLRAVAAAGREVMTALQAAPARAAPADPPDGGGADPAPILPRPHHERRRLSLAEVPELIDHAFFIQREGTGTVRDRFPVVPMTMTIAMFVDAAALLGGGRVVVGLQNVRALRWLAVEPPVDVDITAAFEAPDRVKVAIEGYARATVLLADRYPPAPPPDRAPLADERPPPHSARELYEQRWMFHGPAYRGVTGMHAMGADGLRATVTALPAPGALLDAAGQLLGYWIEANSSEDRIALPMRIDRIDLHGPHPEPGAALDCVVRFTEVNETDARGNVDLVRDGALWARLTQFIDRRFESTDAVFQVMTFPEVNLLADRRDGYWYMDEHWRSSASRDLVARRYLGEDERDEYFALTPKAQRDWILGRIAVKDAVRDVLWQRGAGPIFPLEVRVTNDGAGRPVVELPGGDRLAVSLAHGNGVAVATVAEEGDAGIDVEVVEPRSEAFAAMCLSDDEL